MLRRKKTQTPVYLFLTLYRAEGMPLSVRLDLNKVHSLLIVLTTIVVLFLIGTLLFFREMELNRKLQTRILELELDTIMQTQIMPTSKSLTAPLTNAEQRTVAVLEVPQGKPVEVVKSQPVKAPRQILGRLNDLSVDCTKDQCTVRSLLVPSEVGTAYGEVLIVLETEVPRIGARDPGTQVRMRFHIYPGFDTRDELSQEHLHKFRKKAFRFSKALQTTTNFKMGQLMRPLAVNFYLYDEKGRLIQHERKSIEMAETNVEPN